MSEAVAPVRPGKLIINGEAVDAASGRTFETRNPATEERITDVAEAGLEDVDRAVRAARAAFDGGPWRTMRPAERARLLWKLGDLVLAHADELALLETLDNGKPIFESRQVDIGMVAGCFHYFSGWASKLTGDTTDVSPSFFTYTLREPVGVVGAILPWNFPMIMVGWKAAPALAAGNTIVIKPAAETHTVATSQHHSSPCPAKCMPAQAASNGMGVTSRVVIMMNRVSPAPFRALEKTTFMASNRQ